MPSNQIIAATGLRLGPLWRGGLCALALALLCTANPGPGADAAPARNDSAPGLQASRGQLAQAAGARQRAYKRGGVPVEYLGRKSRLPHATMIIRAGSELYDAKCARCHGPEGRGDGTDSAALTPAPAFLAYTLKRPDSSDDYLLWTIADGGAEFGTAMPAFKGDLSTRQIWQIVEFMRAGFPELEGTDK